MEAVSRAPAVGRGGGDFDCIDPGAAPESPGLYMLSPVQGGRPASSDIDLAESVGVMVLQLSASSVGPGSPCLVLSTATVPRRHSGLVGGHARAVAAEPGAAEHP
mmetsp:Transcript_56544/g.150733  ORF Transcript_56544/g.150733 Transcript_56544/m.150733 type:complete len:105 (+) Transcript_56544:253-567(+)